MRVQRRCVVDTKDSVPSRRRIACDPANPNFLAGVPRNPWCGSRLAARRCESPGAPKRTVAFNNPSCSTVHNAEVRSLRCGAPPGGCSQSAKPRGYAPAPESPGTLVPRGRPILDVEREASPDQHLDPRDLDIHRGLPARLSRGGCLATVDYQPNIGLPHPALPDESSPANEDRRIRSHRNDR